MSAIHVLARNSWNAQDELNLAEERLRAQAMQDRRQGILITKIGAGHYVLALSEHVPFGVTREETVKPPLP